MTGRPSDASGEAPDGLPAALLSAWRAAEDRLYPMVMVRPERYEQVVGLVGHAAAELQVSSPDMASLVDAAPGVADLVKRLAAAGGEPLGPADELDLPLIAAAACAIRYRQLAAERSRSRRAEWMAAAKAAGDTWVVVEQGQPPTSWPPLPSTTVELHLPSGRALVETILVDPGTGEHSFVLAEIRLDLKTGDPTANEPSGWGQDYDNEELWRAAIEKHRSVIERDRPTS